jgi:hypothetical protein
MFSPILLSTLKLKDKYVVTGPYYMDFPNPTEPDLIITKTSNIIMGLLSILNIER